MESEQMDEVGLGKSLQDARKKSGLTQQELCQKAGISYSTLAKIERGAIKSPSVFTIQNIATALGLTLSQLMGDKTSPGDGKRRSQSGVRFIYFDINGVLVRFFQKAFTKLSTDIKVPADSIETAFWHFNDSACRGEMLAEEFNKAFSERLGVPYFEWQMYYFDAIEPITEMHKLAEWADQFYHVGLLSNIMPGFMDVMFTKGLLPDIDYDAIIDSSKVGAIKPEPRIFELAQEWTDCDPSEVLLIDDSRTNLMAAERFGWHVLWFDYLHPEESANHIRETLAPVG